MSTMSIIRARPVAVDDGSRVSTACFIASVMGPCDGVGSKQATAASPEAYPWEVFWNVDSPVGWGNTGDFHGVWLSQHGVYVSDEVDTDKIYKIIGYCAYQNIPWFNDDRVLRMAQEN